MRAPLLLLAAALALRPALTFAAEPAPDTLPLHDAATRAVQDLIDHWWIGDAASGHLQPTHGGCAVDKGRGVIWERATVMAVLEGRAAATGDATARERICAQWRYDKSQYKSAELRACGPGSSAPWCDDATWEAVYYVIAYQQSGDPDALAAAEGILEQIHTLWFDDQLGGGLWYNNDRKVKSLYSVAYVYGALGAYEATGNRHYLDLARAEYDWIEQHLLREDHLYWCDFSAGPPANPEHPAGPVGVGRPHDIHTAGSVTYLGGNLGMAACQAWLYSLTGEDAWRTAALRTTTALHEHLCDSAGRFINDRDAFTNGFFASAWARRMAGLRGSEPALEDLRRTALAIARLRTGPGYTPAYGPRGAGFYPGDWDGGSRWEGKESLANMMHVSATSVAILAAAAELESPIK
ncbi:MAG: glycoside hydrolase family 76 protein [Chthoniobacter sp.]|nr:glycoside hydrolase family 76 protein [Chthoniobacter sp.]